MYIFLPLFICNELFSWSSLASQLLFGKLTGSLRKARKSSCSTTRSEGVGGVAVPGAYRTIHAVYIDVRQKDYTIARFSLVHS